MARRPAPWQRAAVACVALLGTATCLAGGLTDIETRWLRGAWPVISQARADRLPLDLVVQPQPTPEAVPLALGFVDGRCKLVLSLRENPAAARAPGACRTWGVEAKFGPSEDSFCRICRPIA